MSLEKRFAILIDADNISPSYIKIILDEISNKGIATYKRIYGDWTAPQLTPWKKILLDFSITPMQQYGYTIGKNATDSAMIIDAMDILYTGKVDGFCLATSDSDFTKLASRLREAGMTVIGMGEEKTPRPFVSACDEFKFVDKLSKKVEKQIFPIAQEVAITAPKARRSRLTEIKAKETPTKEKTETSQTDIDTIKATLVALINDNSDDDGWMLLSDLGTMLPKRHADFDVRNFGHKKMVPFLESFNMFEIKKTTDPENIKNPNGKTAYIKIITVPLI